MEESKTMNNLIIIFFKIPKVWQHDRMTLEAKITPFFNKDIMIDTFKFTSKSKIWNNFCAGYSIRKLSAHLSPDLYLGRAKGQVWGILLTIINGQF